MSEHEREHEDLLQRQFLRDEGSDASELRPPVEDCDACRDELERLTQARAELSAALAQERADIEGAVALAGTEDEVLVRGALARVLAREQPRRSRRWLTLAAVAAALLLALLGWRMFSPAEGPREILLDGGTIRCLMPSEEVDDYKRFAWEFDLPSGARYELRIYARGEDGKGDLLKQVPLSDPWWIPTADEERSLAERIVWEVTARSIDGRDLASGQCTASRR